MEQNNSFITKIKTFYETKYKLLLTITFLILFAALTQIGIQYVTTGSFMNKGVSLTGGITITIPNVVYTESMQATLMEKFPNTDILSRVLKDSSGKESGVVIDAAIHDEETITTLISEIEAITAVPKEEMSIETFGSRLSEDFFKQLLIGLLIAFLFMGSVVFLYFKDLIPSGAVMLAAFSDIIITLAIVNILGMKISTAGIAAFLMLIGYSVDTDILLTIRVLKQKEDGTLNERIYGAMKTGALMTITAIVAVATVLVFTNSEVLFQIMAILCIGLCVDLMTTWVQNVGVLRWYYATKEKKV